MFQTLQRRLLLSYLGVLAIVLGVFSIAVRFTFAQSLTAQITDRLTALGEGAATNTEYDNGRLKVDSDFLTQDLIVRKQALQWFNANGQLLDQQGKYVLSLPLLARSVQIEPGHERIQGVTLPVINSDDGRIVGYVRASQSLAESDETLERLDLGLGGGVLAALVVSGLGGILLTRQAMQPIEQSFQRLQQFTADASHELRSPLMAIKSNAAVALKYPQGMRDLDAEKFDAIASATSQMTRLTEDLLWLARNDRRLDRNWEIIDLTAILQHLLQFYQPAAAAKQIALKADLPASLPAVGDAGQITQLLTNLIANALHYTPATGTIEIQATRKGAILQVKIRDTGIGIAPDDIKHIFDRFWRADRSRAYGSEGSGLGLAIAQGIAQAHGGSIEVSSQVGVGSCFTFRLPVRAIGAS